APRDDLTIEVSDNGKGIPDDITGSGLTNLSKRAQEVGGMFRIESRAQGGTLLRWSAPPLSQREVIQRLALPRDNHRHAGRMHHSGAHRAEQQPGEAPAAVAADHD
ncbi:MAG TPA: hypothetical protein VMU34_13905, partial [Mycobacterium sp.]|nr:hypothetical protein [Mycobacterium sp.]